MSQSPWNKVICPECRGHGARTCTKKTCESAQMRDCDKSFPCAIKCTLCNGEGEITSERVTMREIQTSLPWTIRYSRDFRANPQPHKDFAHGLVHVAKATGKLMALVDDMDHDRQVADDPKLRDTYGKYVADLVVCAMRIANTFPGGVLDLEKAVLDRLREKNPLSFPKGNLSDIIRWGLLPDCPTCKASAQTPCVPDGQICIARLPKKSPAPFEHEDIP
jgi:hypothetical protein